MYGLFTWSHILKVVFPLAPQLSQGRYFFQVLHIDSMDAIGCAHLAADLLRLL